MMKTALIYCIGIFLILALAFEANSKDIYTVKSHQVNEDEEYVYYSDTKNDHTEVTRKVKKPKPRKYPESVTLIKTNDFPVQVQYLYEELYADGSVKTNYQYRTKTKRERAKITLPPIPEIETEPKGKADALGHAIKRRKESLKREAAKTNVVKRLHMKKVDRVKKSYVEKGKIIHVRESGKKFSEPLKKAYTARVKCAPVKDYELSDSAFSAIGPDGHKSPNFPAATINKTKKRENSKDDTRRGN